MKINKIIKKSNLTFLITFLFINIEASSTAERVKVHPDYPGMSTRQLEQEASRLRNKLDISLIEHEKTKEELFYLKNIINSISETLSGAESIYYKIDEEFGVLNSIQAQRLGSRYKHDALISNEKIMLIKGLCSKIQCVLPEKNDELIQLELASQAVQSQDQQEEKVSQ